MVISLVSGCPNSGYVLFQDAPVVVVFGTSTHLQSLLQAVKTVTNGQTAQRQLTFVSGSEELGTSDNVIAGFANEFAGSLTIQLAENSDTGMGAWLTGQINIMFLTCLSSLFFFFSFHFHGCWGRGGKDGWQ